MFREAFRYVEAFVARGKYYHVFRDCLGRRLRGFKRLRIRDIVSSTLNGYNV